MFSNIEHSLSKIPLLIEELNGKQIEREELISLLIVTFFANKNMFLLGEPGVSKTGILNIFSTILSDGKVFELTIKNDTKYEELFGDRYRDENDKLIYDTSDSIVDSHISILDEVWKGNSKILNSLLSATSDYRTVDIRGEGKIKIPNISTFGASNELPQETSLKALRDRFHVMYLVEEIKEDKNWLKFISSNYDKDTTLNTTFTISEVELLKSISNDIHIAENIYMKVLEIKNTVNTLKISSSSRRFAGSIEILKMSALLSRRKEVSVIDLFLIIYIIWEKESDLENVRKLVFEQVFGTTNEYEILINKTIEELKNLKSLRYGNFDNFLSFREEFTNDNILVFQSNLDVIRNHLNNLIILGNNINTILKHYDYSMELERMIEEHLFLPNYKSHVYEVIEIEDIKNIYSEIEEEYKYFNLWIETYSTLYKYNDRSKNKNEGK